MTINEKQEEIIADFEMFTDWPDKYDYIISLGKALEGLDEKDKVPQNIVKGCQSNIWLISELKDGKIYFKAESDALIVKGLVALMLRIFNGQKPEDILNAEMFFLERIGLQQHLSPTRSNGLLALIKQLKFYSLAYQSKLAQNGR